MQLTCGQWRLFINNVLPFIAACKIFKSSITSRFKTVYANFTPSVLVKRSNISSRDASFAIAFESVTPSTLIPNGTWQAADTTQNLT